MKRRIIELTIVVLSFSVGMTVGKLTDWGYFELSREISIIEALTLFATIGLAIYISRVLEKEAEGVRIEKALYVGKLSEMELILRSIEVLFESTEISYAIATARLQACHIRKSSLCKSMRSGIKRGRVADIDVFEKQLTESLVLLKHLLTETVKGEDANEDIKLESGVLSYSLSRVNEIGSSINGILEQLFRMKIWVNNL